MHETGVEILQMLKQISAYDNSSESRLGPAWSRARKETPQCRYIAADIDGAMNST